MTPLPNAFLATPLAHRAYHDRNAGRPENSRGAFRAAIAEGFGIECDVQMSKDGVAMVFHDHVLDRLTAETGSVHDRTAAELATIRLRDCDEGIPTLAEMLALVAGRVPLLIEIKDQDRMMGPNVGPLEQAVARDLAAYQGPVAVMSFNPHSVAAFGTAAPGIPLGLTTMEYQPPDWPGLAADQLDHLNAIRDYDRLGASFLSHEFTDLDRPRVADLKAKGAVILCWTIRSPEAEAAARKIADNVTFETYDPRKG
jgi:glycerophosphoryl diester phosphodiesterase